MRPAIVARSVMLAAIIASAMPALAPAKGSSGGYSSHAYRSHAVPGVARDSHNRIARSSSAKHEFQKQQPCPATGKTSGPCGGYVIDHVVPLKRGGPDVPSNMQWQTTQAAKIKDRTE
jgi:hypothetical protein